MVYLPIHYSLYVFKKLLVKGYKWPIQSVINCLRNCFGNSSKVYEIVLTIVQKSEQLF